MLKKTNITCFSSYVESSYKVIITTIMGHEYKMGLSGVWESAGAEGEEESTES
jgi:hypothetical protein